MRVWDRLDELTRTRIKMALVALLIVLGALIVIVRLGGRWVRRLGAEDGDLAMRSREPRPFLKPLSEEEARLAVRLPGQEPPETPPDNAAGTDNTSDPPDTTE